MKQYYTIINPKNKFRTLLNILNERKVQRAIIFCKTRNYTSILAEKLRSNGYDAEALHGGFTQAQRNNILNIFRRGKLRFLIATDVAARGLDIEGISHIINYDIPLEPQVYFHRIGRTARIGKEGTAITLVGYGEISELNQIKALTKTDIEKLEDEIYMIH
jgi:ATP-dependent RNA helicase DeaD